jgi:hypothetical protein
MRQKIKLKNQTLWRFLHKKRNIFRDEYMCVSSSSSHHTVLHLTLNEKSREVKISRKKFIEPKRSQFSNKSNKENIFNIYFSHSRPENFSYHNSYQRVHEIPYDSKNIHNILSFEF